jgi:GT2 family glycosyltransferase
MVGSLIGELESMRQKGHQVRWNYIVSSALAWARNMSVYQAIKDEYDYLYFWDSDISIIEHEGFLDELIKLSIEKDAGVVGALYSLKGFPTEYAARDIDEKRIVADINAGHFLDPQKTGDKELELRQLPTEPFEASVIGTGSLLVRVSDLKKLTPPWFSFVDKMVEGAPAVWPEDYNFCDELRKHTKIYADPRIKTMHWGSYAFM